MCKKVNINKRTRNNLNDYALGKCSFSRHNSFILGCQRVGRKYFCSVNHVVITIIDSKVATTAVFSKYENNWDMKDKILLITDKDLNKEIASYSSLVSLIDKLSAFKIDKNVKEITVTNQKVHHVRLMGANHVM